MTFIFRDRESEIGIASKMKIICAGFPKEKEMRM